MLASLLSTLPEDLPCEVILADDGSSDGTRAWLAELEDPRVRVLLNERNLGYAKTCNRGALEAKGYLLCFVNNDVEFTPGWLEPMEQLLNSSPEVGVVGNMHLRFDDGRTDHAGVALSPNGQFFHLTELPLENDMLAVSGACILIRRMDFLSVGGFDEKFVNGGEDLDLCFKLRTSGKRIVLARGSCIRHRVSLSRGHVSERDLQNSRLLFGKWRREIKAELTQLWCSILENGHGNYIERFQGELTKKFLRSPYLAADSIADWMIRREEDYWARTLDGKVVTPSVRAHGLRYTAEEKFYYLERKAIFVVKGDALLRGFYLCGQLFEVRKSPTQRIDSMFRRLLGANHKPTLTFEIDGVQRVSFPLEMNTNINVGVVYPVWLPLDEHHIKVILPFGRLKVIHWVVNDEVVKP